jgi:hypothetical protein
MPKRFCYHQYYRRRMWKMHEFFNPLYISLAVRWNIVLSVCLISLLSKNPLFYLFSRFPSHCYFLEVYWIVSILTNGLLISDYRYTFVIFLEQQQQTELSPDSSWSKHYGTIAKVLGKGLYIREGAIFTSSLIKNAGDYGLAAFQILTISSKGCRKLLLQSLERLSS